VPTLPNPTAQQPAARRVDGSMSLLNDLMTQTLDEGYAERAAPVTSPSARSVTTAVPRRPRRRTRRPASGGAARRW
jgi:hypothetical protein